VATTIWLVRHGQTQSNADGLFQGQLDVPLNDVGRRQARTVAGVLRDTIFDGVYSSDLSRCVQTAELIVGPSGTPVVQDSALRELHYGILQGTSIHEAASSLTAHGLGENWKSGEFTRRGLAAPGGESILQMRRRLNRFLVSLDAAHPPSQGQRVLLILHGGTLRVLLTILLGLPASARYSFVFDNCSISRVVRGAAGSRLELLNQVCW
jgi:alpha-ribazole phosphatase/probable phosphoglycerate mutase